MSTPAATTTTTVPVVLTTSLTSLSIPGGPYIVPTDWRRTQLSTLVNKLLQNTDASIPFDFIINGQLLRTSLGEYLASVGATTESTLQIEYVRSTLPPSYVAAFEHDDWVASADASLSGKFLTASYDGAVRVFSASNSEVAEVTFSTVRAGSSNPAITDARWTQFDKEIVTAGMDGTVRFWTVSGDKKWNGEFHSQPVASLDVCEGQSENVTSHIMSAGWDGAIALWDEDGQAPFQQVDEASASDSEEEEEQDGRRKRQRTKAGAKKAAAVKDRLRKDPVMNVWHTALASSAALAKSSGSSLVPGANAKVARAAFQKTQGGKKDPNVAWSAGWDGSVKRWDFGVGGICSASKTSDKVMLCMDQIAPTSSNGVMIITGHVDRSAAIWDMRTEATQVATHLSAAHSAPVSSIQAHPLSSTIFSTASHDGTVKLWDSRSPKRALFSLTRPSTANTSPLQDKVLALDWSPDGQVIVAGGQDKKITLHRGSGIGV